MMQAGTQCCCVGIAQHSVTHGCQVGDGCSQRSCEALLEALLLLFKQQQDVLFMQLVLLLQIKTNQCVQHIIQLYKGQQTDYGQKAALLLYHISINNRFGHRGEGPANRKAEQ